MISKYAYDTTKEEDYGLVIDQSLSRKEIEHNIRVQRAPCSLCAITKTCTQAQKCMIYQKWKKEVYLPKKRKMGK